MKAVFREVASHVTLILLWLIAAEQTVEAAETLSFEQHVRPILKAYCLDCHGGGEKLEGGLDLRLKRLALKGGESGVAFESGNPQNSLLIKRLKSGEMPPTEKKVPPEQIAIIEQWIASGAKTLRDEPAELPVGLEITPEERSFWFFQPLRRIEPPQFPTADRVRTPIDAFVLQKLKTQGFGFSPEADKQTLIRRAAFDLTGLPPTDADVAAFVQDSSEAAYEKMLDRLLESPHYGERWARHWLDVAGYADSEGNGTEDTPRPYAWKFRDYVIRSLNADKPLDQFIIEQLAGDELAARPWANMNPEQIEKLTATYFLRLGVDATATGGDDAANSNQAVADSIKILSSSLLGLTVGCAQCHDHRYDPVPQSDYFRLRAIIDPAFDTQHWRRPGQRLVSLYTDADRAKAAEVEAEAQKLQAVLNEKTQQAINAALEKELLKFPEDQREKLRAAYQTPGDKRTDEQKQLLASNPSVNINAGNLYQYDMAKSDELKKDAEEIAKKRAEKPVEDFLSVLSEVPGTAPPTHVFHRGDYRQPKQAVKPGDLTIAAPDGARFEIPEDNPDLPTTGRRLAYAKHLMSGTHPLVGRVLANRIWLNHFGRGLVETPGDFGVLGRRPSHPELLDWLATELPLHGWRLKSLHKLIMMSTVYRQSSRRNPELDAVDTDNEWLGRFPLRRLDAESLRDHLLVVSGRLDRNLFGASVPVDEDFVGQVVAKDDTPRRSIYLQARRSKPVSLLTAFDAPVMAVNCERRLSTTAAPQSLMLMNSDFVLKQAEHVAKRVRAETPADFLKELTAPLEVRSQRPVAVWLYGFGEFNGEKKQVVSFTSLPHWTGSAWQGGPTLPDLTYGYAIVHAAGGHAGNDEQHASIRRWVAPSAGVVSITGRFKHAADCGNGVRGRLVSSRAGLLGEWQAKKSDAATNVERLEVQAGDTLDFVVDLFGELSCDSYEWLADISLTSADGKMIGNWNSSSDFHGPLGIGLPKQIAFAWQLVYQRPIAAEELEIACDFASRQLTQLRLNKAPGDQELTMLTSLCQQLLSSNEFLYVD